MPQRLCSAVLTTAGKFPGYLRICITACCLALCSQAVQAQSAPDFQYLIFEAVPLATLASASEPREDTGTASASGSSQPASLTSNPSDLQSWLGSRQLSTLNQTAESLSPDISRYERVLTEMELAQGPYAPRLDEELLALGNLHQRVGDHTKALEALERAIHISRVNNGLFNLGQMPIIEKAIESHLARGDLVAADAQQEYLFYLQRKSLGETSVALLPALTRYAEWNVFAYNARPQLLTPPPASEDEGAGTASATAVTAIANLEGFRFRRLMLAQNLYQTVIQILVNNFGPSDPRLPEFERRLAITNYFFATTYDPSANFGPGSTAAYSGLMPYESPQAANNSLGYRQGKDALERRIAYLENAEQLDPQALARAHVDLGDWYLRFRKRTGALEAYQAAHKVLHDADVAQAEIDRLLSPPLPVPVPDFLIHPYTRQAFDVPREIALDYKGYIDVEFTVNRYGAPGTVKVLGKSEGTPAPVESRLLRNLRRDIFRPRHEAGTVRESDQQRLRYYYTY